MCEVMAPHLVIFSSILLVLCCTVSGSIFSDSNPIFMVSDHLQEIESEVIRAIGRTPQTLQFARFAHRYGKRYATEEEMRLRYINFVDTLKMIKSTNKKHLSYKLGVNEFADWSWEEFREKRLLKAPQNCSATSTTTLKLSYGAPPESKDWRKEGIVSPVKDQGKQCGSCWTFSTTGALEAAYAQAHQKKNISLSEQQLLDCAGRFNNSGCAGGLPSQAFEYIKYDGGLVREKEYPYTGVQGKCKYHPGENVTAIRVNEVVNITQGGEDDLELAVALIRPVSVAFEVMDDFRAYKSGVYSSKTCRNSPSDVNHAVLAVGYGVEPQLGVPTPIPYWIAKNSWGQDWGDHGYFKILKGVNMCGIATCASYPTLVV